MNLSCPIVKLFFSNYGLLKPEASAQIQFQCIEDPLNPSNIDRVKLYPRLYMLLTNPFILSFLDIFILPAATPP